jgi:hypothetical protein
MPGPIEKLFTDNWPIRRRWLRMALVWMVLNVQAILIAGFFKIEIAASVLHQNAMITMLTAIVSLLGFYVFGAVWDDNNKRSRFQPRDSFPDPYFEPIKNDRRSSETIAPDEDETGRSDQ